MSARLRETWQAPLAEILASDGMTRLREFLVEENRRGAVIYPPAKLYFNALDQTPLTKVRVVILGQDPYHGPGQAHGLSFSVPRGVTPPPSLVNILNEIARDLDISKPKHGELLHWAQQGVLLLNAVLSVRAGAAGSHAGKGWEAFTDRVIEVINEKCENVVFMLWGKYAWDKGRIIDARRHLVLKSPHPSPLSAHRGFVGCAHFSKANSYLRQHKRDEIDWSLPT
jgi:uracil-DNA glycosylase